MPSLQPKKITKFLRSPIVIIFSVFLGAFLGIFLPKFVPPLVWIGNAYLSFLKLCALPIMLSSIIVGITRLFKDKESGKIIWQLLVAVFASFTIYNVITILIGLVTHIGKLDESGLALLGNEVNKTGIDFTIYLFQLNPSPTNLNEGFSSLLNNLISENIFQSLAQGKTLEVLTFAIALGATISFLPDSPRRNNFIESLDFVFQIFNSLVRAALIFLPIALVGLIGGQVKNTGLGTIQLMLNFVILANICLAIGYLISVVIIWLLAKKPKIPILLREIKETSILAVTTSNSLACLPSALSMMTNLRFNAEKVNLLLPINIITFRYGTSIYFVLATIFILNIYQKPLDFNIFLTILFGCILGSLSSLGLVGIAVLGSIDVVCRPLGLPTEAVLLLLIAIDPLVNPFRTLVNIYASMMVTSSLTKLDLE